MNNERAAGYWQNNQLAVWSVYLSAVVIIFLALMIGLGAIGTLIPFQAANLGQAMMLAILGIATVSGGIAVWRLGRKAALNRAELRADGVHFFYGCRETDQIAWADIARVTHDNGSVTIHAGKDRMLSFDGYSFFLPSNLGRAIAARAGKPLQSSKH